MPACVLVVEPSAFGGKVRGCGDGGGGKVGGWVGLVIVREYSPAGER